MIKCILALTLGAILFAASVNAQTYGTISAPNIFGDRTIRYNNGLNGTSSAPNVFGDRTLRYHNGTTIQYGAPNIFGDRSIRIHNNGWGW
jgi:hypothetical protein